MLDGEEELLVDLLANITGRGMYWNEDHVLELANYAVRQAGEPPLTKKWLTGLYKRNKRAKAFTGLYKRIMR